MKLNRLLFALGLWAMLFVAVHAADKSPLTLTAAIWAEHVYEGPENEVVRGYHEVADGEHTVLFSGPYLDCYLTFNDAVSTASMAAHLKVRGPQPSRIGKNGRPELIVLGFSHLEQTTTPIQIEILPGLTSEHGLQWNSPWRISLEQLDETRASWTLLGQQDTYRNLESLQENCDFEFGAGGNQLTTSRKHFVVEFSRPVDRASVTQALLRGLGATSTTARLAFQSDRKLDLLLPQVPAGRYCLRLSEARDARGYAIRGNLLFQTRPGGQLGRLDLHSKQAEIVYAFADRIYASAFMNRVGRHVVLDAEDGNKIFDLHTMTMKDVPRSLAIPWILPRAARPASMVLARKSDHLWLLDLDTLETTSLGLSVAEVSGLSASCLSPLGALVGGVDQGKILVRSLDGKILFASPDVEIQEREGISLDPEVQFIDERHIAANTREGIQVWEIATGLRTLHLPDADRLIADQASGSLIYARHDGEGNEPLFCLRPGEARERAIPSNSNVIFLNRETLIYNRGHDIIRYTFENEKEEVLGTGRIIGLSADGRFLYFNTFEGDFFYGC